MGMKFRSWFAACFFVVGMALHDTARADDLPLQGTGDGGVFRSSGDPFGIHFRSEDPFDEISLTPLLGNHDGAGGLQNQADTAGLRELGLAGDWRPFGNGFRLSFAMYLDPIEADEYEDRDRSPFVPDGDPVSLSGDFEFIPYVGVGWRTNGQEHEGLGMNLEIGAFLPRQSSLTRGACPQDAAASPAGCRVTASLNDHSGSLLGSFQDFEWYPVISMGLEYRF